MCKKPTGWYRSRDKKTELEIQKIPVWWYGSWEEKTEFGNVESTGMEETGGEQGIGEQLLFSRKDKAKATSYDIHSMSPFKLSRPWDYTSLFLIWNPGSTFWTSSFPYSTFRFPSPVTFGIVPYLNVVGLILIQCSCLGMSRFPLSFEWKNECAYVFGGLYLSFCSIVFGS